MKSTVRMIGFCLVALAFLAAPAYANEVDVTDTSGFGAVILGPTTTTFSNGFNFNADVQTTVWLNAGVYTYVYTISNYTGGNPVDIFSIAGNFDSSLDWGTVTGATFTSSGVGRDNPDATTFGSPAPFCSQNGFLGCADSGVTFFFSDGSGTTGGLDSNGEFITVYAQSFSGPGTGQQSAILIDSDHAIGSVPAPVPEPGTMALFGSGMIGLAFAIRRRLQG